MGTSHFHDIWRSTDYGATWVQIASSPGWSERCRSNCVVTPDGSVVLLGGGENGGGYYLNDVWRLISPGSTEQNPSHTYSQPGNYQVALQPYKQVGYNSTRQNGYILVVSDPVANFYG